MPSCCTVHEITMLLSRGGGLCRYVHRAWNDHAAEREGGLYDAVMCTVHGTAMLLSGGGGLYDAVIYTLHGTTML